MSSKESVSRAHRIKAEQEAHIASTMADVLIDECLERLGPILTHKRKVRYMRIPVDYEHDDDVFILERLREVRKRLRRRLENLQCRLSDSDDQES